MEGDLQVRLEIMDLIQADQWCLLMAMEEDTSHRGTVEMAFIWQLVKALQDDYIKLRGNLHLLQHQTSDGRPQERKTHKALPQPDLGQKINTTTTVMEPPIPAEKEGRPTSLRTPSLGEPFWLGTGTNALITCHIALLTGWLSTRSRWSWHDRPGTLPKRCIKRLWWMVIQRSANSYMLCGSVIPNVHARKNSSGFFSFETLFSTQ